MSANPCQICGCTDLNLVDGFFYCVECGTQDVNVRETVVEKTIYEEYGTFTGTDTRKYKTVLKDAFQMSEEWCKWHVYNFILVGLTDELLALGAKPTVKLKVLWIWLRYIKKYQKKDQPEATLFENKTSNEEAEKESSEGDTDNELDESGSDEKKRQIRGQPDADYRTIKKLTSTLLLSILYTALNLDRSNIQLSHLFQFIREGRLSINDCYKFVPKELSMKYVPNRAQFKSSVLFWHRSGGVRELTIRLTSMTLIKCLNLGVPLVPDLNKITNNFIRELGLPKDFKDLVLSLTDLLPCDPLKLDASSIKDSYSVPNYEGYCMSYILLALKMCFGSDGDYEIKLSDAVDKINCEEDYLKCYKLGIHSEPTDRLFSFREWCKFIQFRKMVLCKYYLPLANQHQTSVDDCVFMEHTGPRKTQSMRLSYDVAMDILNKIPTNSTSVIPKKEFPVTLTPMTTYTEVVREHIDDPDLKLRFCEDFTQYSLKYATQDLKLPGFKMNKGVDQSNKNLNPFLTIGNLPHNEGDSTMVLVRNCDNKNWLKTKPPRIKHVTKINNNRSNNGNSICELTSETETDDSGSEDEDSKHDSVEETCDVIEEEDEELCIFDDDFKNLKIEDDKKEDQTYLEETDGFAFHFKKGVHGSKTDLHASGTDIYDSEIDSHDTISEISVPENFDRDKVIRELIEIVCKKFKMRVPKGNEEVVKRPRKRKYLESSEAGVSEPKKKNTGDRMKPGEAAKMMLELIDAYYENIKNDLILQISEQVKSAIETAEIQAKYNTTDDALNNVTEDALNNVTEDAHNNITENAHNNITEVAPNNITEDALGNNQTEEIGALNQNNVDEDHQNDTNVLDDDQVVSVHDNDNQDGTANSAIDDDDDAEYNIEELLPKVEPKFDPKTHDIKQLYLNFNDEFEYYDISNIDNDPDINNLIDKKIADCRDFSENDKALHENDVDKDETSESNESDNDVPSTDELEGKLSYMRKRDDIKLKYLIKNRKITMFRYWRNTFQSKNYKSSSEMTHKFNIELAESFPKSFFFVINECAVISNCSAYSLFRKLDYWESIILGHLKK